MRLGVVLAAGDSTRLPGKLLLPTRDGAVTKSAVDFCRRSGCCSVTAIVRAIGSPVWTYLARACGVESFVEQPVALGVTHALSLVRVRADEVLVTFADNVYGDAIALEECGASVRAVVAPNADQLDGWDGRKWVDRSQIPFLKFAGWWLASQEMLKAVARHTSLMGAFNELGVKPVQVDGPWWDIGTSEAFDYYWRRTSTTVA